MVLKHPYTNRYTYSHNKWDLVTLLLIMQMVDVSFVESLILNTTNMSLIFTDVFVCAYVQTGRRNWSPWKCVYKVKVRQDMRDYPEK